ncbi:hypothetical protein, partial [Streptococcus pseudopneumoniae]|uniref:hypothetical protein n=1 Tax=Streptococcus pseudopneumoniae TaxID=257758 RepID=UPI001BB1595D
LELHNIRDTIIACLKDVCFVCNKHNLHELKPLIAKMQQNPHYAPFVNNYTKESYLQSLVEQKIPTTITIDAPNNKTKGKKFFALIGVNNLEIDVQKGKVIIKK